MRFTWRTEWPHWLLVVGMLILAAGSWSSAPDRIPVHWDWAGQVDRYGGRFEGLLLIPLLAVGIYLGMLLLPRVDPGRANYDSFVGAYSTLRLGILAVLAVLYGVIHLWIRGHQASVEVWVPLVVGALFVVVGNQLGKIRPNWFFGIRTPWTLSSKVAWTHTHRAGGWLFIVMGTLFMFFAVLRVAWVLWFMIGISITGVLGLVVYSYLLWRDDPEKIPPAGTLPAGN